MGMLKAIPAHL